MKIRLTLDPASVADTEAAFHRLAAFIQRPTIALKRIGFYQQRVYQKAFDANQDPATGKTWPPLAPSTVAQKRNQKPLVEKVGRIPASLFHEVQRGRLVVGYGDRLAALHHTGAKIRPHRIIPKNKKALYWKGAKHPVKSVNHPGSTLPARRLIGYSPADIAEWGEIVKEEAQRAFEG